MREGATVQLYARCEEKWKWILGGWAGRALLKPPMKSGSAHTGKPICEACSWHSECFEAKRPPLQWVNIGYCISSLNFNRCSHRIGRRKTYNHVCQILSLDITHSGQIHIVYQIMLWMKISIDVIEIEFITRSWAYATFWMYFASVLFFLLMFECWVVVFAVVYRSMSFNFPRWICKLRWEEYRHTSAWAANLSSPLQSAHSRRWSAIIHTESLCK